MSSPALPQTNQLTVAIPKPKLSPLEQQASAGADSPALKQLLQDHWTRSMALSPLWATSLGIHDHDAELESRSPATLERSRELTAEWLKTAQEIAQTPELSPRDRTTLSLLTDALQSSVSAEVCEFPYWSLSPRGNVITTFNRLPKLHTVKTEQDGQNLLSRYRKVAKVIDEQIANLRTGLTRGLVSNQRSVELTLKLGRTQLAQPLDEWPLMSAATTAHDAWPPATLLSYRTQLKAAIKSGIAPAYRRYVEFLERELLPRARGTGQEGLAALPNGPACYGARARTYTSLKLKPTELHNIGVRELAAINAEMQRLGAKLFGTTELKATFERLRTDPELYFKSEQEIIAKAESALKRAEAKVPEYFQRLPKAPAVVKPVPAYEAPFTTIAYYRPPSQDGEKPGRYFVNVHEPNTRPRYIAEVLAFHEAIPGHHFQIAIAQELPQTPAFRRHTGATAFVEGWALYTERLSDEMGLYSDELDRLGMLNFDAWRAARLVVDTGIHQMGWSRERAEQFLLDHTALAVNNVKNEVDRYITWPGQALAYKVGQLKILELREHAKHRLGERFDIRQFHDLVLSQGAVTLPLLERLVNDWLTATAKGNVH